MTERKQREIPNRRTSLGFVVMLLLSTLGVLATAPASSASLTGSIGISGSSSPVPDAWYSSFDTISFEAEVSNFYNSPSGAARVLTWYACDGDITASSCKSVYDETGQFNMGNIQGQSTELVPSTALWIPGQNAEGTFTIVYSFSQNDQVPSDDELRFTINLTNDFVDVIADTDHNPIEHLQNLAVYDQESVLNTGTDYVFKAKGQSTLCGLCTFTGEFGWQLWDEQETMMLKEAYKTVENLPAWGGYDPYNINLPAFNYGQEGRYMLKFGLFSSTGNPHADLNPSNNLAAYEIVLNDSIDLKVMDVYPSHNAQSSQFYYGNDRVISTFANLGNMSVENITVSYQVYNTQYELEVEDSCDIAVMHPSETETCTFNMTTTGNNRLIRVQLPTIYQNGEDVRMSDNLYSLNANVQVGAINPSVQTNSENNVFLTTEDVELVARFSSIASQPLNYTWREGFYVWGHGQVLNRTGEAFGLGHHNLTLQVTDPWGETEYAYVEFDVLNSINLSVEPYFTGFAITEQEAAFSHDILLPHLGKNYGIGGGDSPLMMIAVDVQSLSSEEEGLRNIGLTMDLTSILPENIDLTTVDIRYLPSTESVEWEFLDGVDGYTFGPDSQTVDISMTKDGVILLIGVLPPTNATAEDVEWTQLVDGQIQLDWTPNGDITNPYVGGWNIYKIQGISGTTVFPETANGINENIWEELTLESLATTLPLGDQTWLDPDRLETGICASYAIIPIDREGNPNLQMANITRVDGVAGQLCGDAIPPSTSLVGLSHTWTFTNSTECYEEQQDWSVCYTVDLSWTWPPHEAQGNVTWNIYRIEARPSNVDLKFIEPIVEGLEGVPGETGTLTQSGLDRNGVQPYRTYYYILAPIDSVGNELMAANYPSDNIERVQIDDDWWTYNQHLIPPEPEPPEPPLGLPWLQKLNDATQVSEFQNAGFVLLGTIVLNFLLLPLLLKRRKRLKRVLEARKRNSAAAMSEFDDFFE
ncbi:MAG: hypothetical protein DWC03_02185 [Candidatus Poseidoniales archaeon]|nr:MAG: hypothetical protein DWC03_02185 [Candidatus Poseidoniales archaeon]